MVSSGHNTELLLARISGWEVMRYRYMLYSAAAEAESDAYNQHCFCHLEEEDRTTGSFLVMPPSPGSFVLRVYGTPEANFSLGQPVSMDFLASFLIQCTRVHPKVAPWPLSDLPWGLTGSFTVSFTLFNHLLQETTSTWASRW